MSTLTNGTFRTAISETIFQSKYAHEGAEDWDTLSRTLVEDVCGGGSTEDPSHKLPQDERDELTKDIQQMFFIPGGRYLYYAGRPLKFFNNCYLLRAESDTREEWGHLAKRSIDCLMTGGGIGIDYSILREKGAPLRRTGGEASGPISLMEMINEIGRRVMQGGSRRSAIYGSLNWQHPDSPEFLKMKNWADLGIGDGSMTHAQAKTADFNHHAPMDMTNVSLNYDNAFLEEVYNLSPGATKTYRSILGTEDLPVEVIPKTFLENVRQAMMTGEPGFSFNFFDKENETLRNACTEVTSEDDSDVCNLASLNMSRIPDIETFRQVVRRATRFLLLGTLVADLPYQKVRDVREKNRRLGLGLMGVHEWLMTRGYRYEVVPELHDWLKVYKEESEKAAKELSEQFGVSSPVAVRAIAPTGTIGIMAGTTTGIEPLFAVAYKRRFLTGGAQWNYEYVIDGTARILIDKYGVDPGNIETALDLAQDPARRIKFQADIQDYVDQSISSTINLPAWGSEVNNEDTVLDMAKTLASQAHRLRGFTAYPDGSRGGQPLTAIPYEDALKSEGETFQEEFMDVCSLTGGGVCGV